MGSAAETAEERRAWDLLARVTIWKPPADHPITVYGSGRQDEVRVQLFELAMATVMACEHPSYEWQVTRQGRDSGLDFYGRQAFFNDQVLGINAAITIGGQCKKRSRVDDVIDAIGSSLVRMARTVNPTFFVVALSARVSPERVREAQEDLERVHLRHCHILDRTQIEGLMSDHLGELESILRSELDAEELAHVTGYLAGRGRGETIVAIEVDRPERVLAGEPLSVEVTVRSTLVSRAGTRLWWIPPVLEDGTPGPVSLISPAGALEPGGVALVGADRTGDPLLARLAIELVTDSVGEVDLGEVVVGRGHEPPSALPERTSLGTVAVVDNARPRFFARPVEGGLLRLGDAFERAQAGGVAVAFVTGAGGSGKSRLCDEFCLARRHTGAAVVTARQAKSQDDPYGVLTALLRGLIEDPADDGQDDADAILRAVSAFDAPLATRVEPTVRALVGASASSGVTAVEHDLVSALLVLVAARTRPAPLIIHLQDLHWSTAEVLRLTGRLIDSLESALPAESSARSSGLLVLLEGRVRESGTVGRDQWSSAAFEAFIDQVDGVRVPCRAFDERESEEFVRRLFEQRHSANRLISDELLGAQEDLILQVERAAGGNPFHTLAQLQLLRERRVVGRNPATGLHYLIHPRPDGVVLPDSVYDAIVRRWNGTNERDPDLALLLWSSALLDDRLPAELFQQLRDALAPATSQREIDASEMLWSGGGLAQDVRFRHENYVAALRSISVPPDRRARAVDVYDEWFASLRSPGASDRFRWARALCEAPEPDWPRVRSLLRSALRIAHRQDNAALARQIQGSLLDVRWADDVRSPLTSQQFLDCCDGELALLRELLDVDRPVAEQRLRAARDRVERRRSDGRRRSPSTRSAIELRHLELEIVRAQYLFNDQRPERAAEIAARVLATLPQDRGLAAEGEASRWDALAMESLHTQAVGVAIAGEVRPAAEFSAEAVRLARGLKTERAHQVIGTHGNILLAIDPEEGVHLLRDCLADQWSRPSDEVDRVEIHLCIGLVILAHRSATDETRRTELLVEARTRLTHIATMSARTGHYPDAGAAALLLGIVAILDGAGDQVALFAQAVAAAARGHQLETEWKAHINLALALHRQHGEVTPLVCEHARTAVDIMEASLQSSAHPDRTPRFGLLRPSLAHAAAFLIQAGDPLGPEVLERYPALRSCFVDGNRGLLRSPLGGDLVDHEWWLDIGGDHYALY